MAKRGPPSTNPQTIATNAYRRRRISEGYCGRCNQENDRGGVLCQTCADQVAERGRRRRAEMRDRVLAHYGGCTA